MGDMYFTYIIKNGSGKLYIGHTSDLDKRLETHNSGRGSRYTSSPDKFSIVYFEKYEKILDAINREKQLKKWSRVKKEALVSGDFKLLKKL